MSAESEDKESASSEDKHSRIANICVVISYWIGHDVKTLKNLLKGMDRYQAGVPYDVIIVCNGGGLSMSGLRKPSGAGTVMIVNRDNQGYNIGAWDAGYRERPNYKYYLFLQSECFIKRSNWLEVFKFRMENDQGVRLLGEGVMWDGLSWDYIKLATARDLGENWYAPSSINPVDFYMSELDRMGIERGAVGTHVQSLVVFVSGSTMQEIGGFPSDSRYEYAIACEIAISRRIAALGYRVALVKPNAPFSVIGHMQWTWAGQAKARLRNVTLGRLGRIRRELRSALKKV